MSARRLLFAFGAIIVLITLGSVGYIMVEGMSPLDALYMTVITISTVGYEEVKPLSTNGRIFTMILIFVGVGTAYYVFAVVTAMVVEGRFSEFVGKTAMQHKIRDFEGHVIVCGYGRFGRVVTGELRHNALAVVVIESDPAKEPELERAGVPYVLGSALEQEVLERAGIARAAEIVVATASDPDNVYISLSARSMNSKIRIHARAESELGLRHLQLAGVDQAVSSYQWSAMRIANTIMRPSVLDFLELLIPGRNEEVDLEEIKVPQTSPLVGRAIRDLEQGTARLRVVALKRGANPLAIIPDPGMVIEAGDFLVAIGSRASLKQLTEPRGA
jgi:voltage-gated potassium channel